MTGVDLLALVGNRTRDALSNRGGWRVGVAVRLVSTLVVLGLLVLALRPSRLPATSSGSITVCEDVSCDHSTIQGAVDAADPGDVISVLDEEHTESGILVNKRVTIVGGNAGGTVVQAAEAEGQAVDRVFEIAAGADVVIEDVTIRYGQATGSPAQGGGILNRGSLELKRATIRANDAVGGRGDPGGRAEGGGIYNRGVLMIEACTLSGNEARGGSGASAGDSGGDAHGGGLFTVSTSVTVVNSTVSGNTARGGASGGG
jgi:hypothetical protein